MTVIIFDKNGGDLIPTLTIEKVGRAQDIDTVCVDQVDQIVGDVAIVHVVDNEWDTIVKSASKGNVRVRMSTAGREGTKEPIINPVGVYVLELVPRAQELTSEQWALIIKALVDLQSLNELVQGRNPNSLRYLFFPQSIEILPALAVLCQGFLVVHASCGGEVKDEKDKDVEEALRQIAWLSLDEAIRKTLCRRLAEQKDRVRDPSWWLSVFGLRDKEGSKRVRNPSQWAEFDRRVANEWEKLGEGPIPPEVRTLLNILGEEDEIAPPSCVAQAYCAIASRLRGQP